MIDVFSIALLSELTGVVAICIAIYLQLVGGRRVPPYYVMMFFLFGCGVLLVHSGNGVLPAAYPLGLRALGIILILVGELFAGYHIGQEYDVHHPIREFKEVSE